MLNAVVSCLNLILICPYLMYRSLEFNDSFFVGTRLASYVICENISNLESSSFGASSKKCFSGVFEHNRGYKSTPQTNFEKKEQKAAVDNFISLRTKKFSTQSAEAWLYYRESEVFALYLHYYGAQLVMDDTVGNCSLRCLRTLGDMKI